MKTIRARCTTCGSEHAFQRQTLDDVRAKCCERCGTRITVTGTEGQDDPPHEMPAVTTAPDIERCIITTRRTEIARGLIESALGTG